MATAGGTDQRDGWRYVVLVSKFVHQFFQEGFLKSLGVLIPTMVVQLNCSYSVAGLVSSLFFTATFVFCPIVRYLSSKLGCRIVSVVGGTMFCVCVSSLYFVKMPAVMGLLLLIAGIGNSCLAQTGYVVLQENFGEQFGSANAVASFGFSFGSLTVPLLSNLLLQTYGLWGTFLILGGLVAHCIPIGATYRSPRPSPRERRTAYDLQESPVEAEGPSERFLGECRSVEACVEDKKDATFQYFPIDHVDAERKSYSYHQVLNGEAERDEGETENDTQEEQEQETDNQNESMPASTCPSACVAIGSSFQSLALTIVKTLALDDLWKEKEFTFFILPCQMFADMTFGCWSLFVVTYGLSVGLDPDTAPYLLSAGVAGGFLSRGLSVVLLQGHQERAPGLYAFFFIAQIGGLFIYPINSSLPYLIFCSMLCGFGLFGIYTTYYAVLNVSVSEDRFSGILAATFFIFGVLMSFSSIITGRMYDVTKSLKTMFMVYGGLGCISAVLILTFIYRRRTNTSSSSI